MSITAKLSSTITGGHGLTEDILTAIHAEMVKGKQAGLIPALVLLQPETYGGAAVKDKRTVTLKVVRLEPCTEQADADRVRLAITETFEARNGDGQTAGQARLDLGEEDARRYLGYVEDWRKEQRLTVTAVKDLWRETFTPDRGVLADYRKAGPTELREFCLTQGIMHDEVDRGDREHVPGSD